VTQQVIPETDPGEAVIEVYVRKPKHEIQHLIPEGLDGIRVKIIETGEIRAHS